MPDTVASDSRQLPVPRLLLAAGPGEARPDAVRKSLVDILKAHGLRRLAIVDTGRAVVNRLTAAPPDLVLIAGDLDDIACWPLVRMLRSGRFGPPALPIIVCHTPQIRTATVRLAQEHDVVAHSLAEPDRLAQVIGDCLVGAAEARPSVLIIEDHASAAELARRGLQSGYLVEIAGDGASGLAAWRARRHDLVLLDLQLPALSGPSVLARIVAERPGQPVVVITAYPSRQRHRDLMLAGAADFIDKPFDLNRLREVCDRVLRQPVYLCDTGQPPRARAEIDRRLLAAEYCLDSGRAALAAIQLKHALAIGRAYRQPPGDDEWLRLLGEAEQC